MKEDIRLKEGVEARLERGLLTVSKNNKELNGTFDHPLVKIGISSDKITFITESDNRKEKSLLKTYKAGIKNLLHGLEEPFVYKLKICSSHFPMDVSLQGNTLQIKNFLGERKPRKAAIPEGVEVNVQGDIITVTSPYKEKAGQAAASIEAATRMTFHDRRRFQDGIYITVKAGEAV